MKPAPQPAPLPPAASAPGALKLTLSQPLVACLLLILALPWAVVIWILAADRRPAEGAAAPVMTSREGLGAIKPAAARYAEGPWGLLKIEPIVVEPPSTFFGWGYDVSPSRRWIIAHATPDQARALLQTSGLDAAAVEVLMGTAVPDPTCGGQILHPPDELLRALAPGVRSALYAELGKNQANSLHATPMRFRGASLHEWFANSGLPAEITARVEPLVYPSGKDLCFTDLHLVLPDIESPLTRIRLLRALHRAATYSLRLEFKPDDSIGHLLAYWGRGDRDYQIEPILESMQHQAGGEGLDVSYLLPDFARTRLYTYINPTRSDPGVRRDCHWTSFNFFNDLPDDQYGRQTDLSEIIRRDYAPINPPLQFGDLIFFISGSNAAIHSCVYIAADLVFTKNGAGFGMPFVFEQLEDVVALYRARFGEFLLQYCRRRRSEN